MNLSCSVCGTDESLVFTGHGDGDFLCTVCNDWRWESVELERKKRQDIMNSPKRSAQVVGGSMSSHCAISLPDLRLHGRMDGHGEALPAPRRIWS